MTDPTPGALHHVELHVPDLARSLAFWGPFLDDLGWLPFQRWKSGASFSLGLTSLVFVETPSKQGLDNVAFHARSREHVDEVTERLKRAGVTILHEDRHPFAGGRDRYSVFFEAPDRIKGELVAPD
jgi:catechol 2,3-dioxygenase-like lactoylglutathione lyase family enzyme